MKTEKINAVHVWQQFEDDLVPRLKLSVIDRAVYSNLLRHSRLIGKRRLHFSIDWLGRNVRLSRGAVRAAVRRLVAHGALRLIERSKAGHVVEVRLPEEIRAARGPARLPHGASLEQVDFLQTRALREALHARERGLCFYCLRRIPRRARCLDHVVPRAQFGRNSYRNLVSCCMDCNSRKLERPAADFLRSLFREGRLSAADLTARLRALHALSSGKFRPSLPS